MSDHALRTQVLIVGAGPVGLALAIELGSRGVRCLVIEQNDRVGVAPRAKTTNVRTREHLRRWGIADKLRDASPLGADYPSTIIFATRLNGRLLARFENASECAPVKNPLFSEHGQWIPQYILEEVLKRHAESLPGVEIRFGCRLIGAEQSERGVAAQVAAQDQKNPLIVESAYLVGADGARSTVRGLIGATMSGATLGRHQNVVFRAPGIGRAHRFPPATMYWLVNAEVPAVTGPMDSGDKWFFGWPRPENMGALNGDTAKGLIRRATGLDLPCEILSSDEWTAHRLIADRYRDRRIFLAGDACHLHPPYGGYGMNMGIGDGVDLGWKLAAVLSGWGGPRLLASYERERRPVHEHVIEEAVTNHALLPKQIWREGLEDDTPAGERLRAEVRAVIEAGKAREFKTLGTVLGYHYSGSPIVVGDGSAPPPRDTMTYIPSAHPGCLAPHAWLDDDTSLYDRFGAGFTLLALDGSEGAAAMQSGAADRGVPLQLLSLRSPQLAELYHARYALIRPDQHVAWRGDRIPADAGAIVDRVRGAPAAAV
jgi:2-polyprenyl-6-methoxyphenol hydroxylase-like FAD-dependent oxidoreductase